MGNYHLRGSHVSLIARTHVKYSIRGGAGLIFVLISLFAGLIMAQAVISPVEMLVNAQEEVGGDAPAGEIVETAIDKSMGVIESFTGASEDQLEYMLKDHPAVVSGFLVLLMFFLPLLISLGAFNQTSGDISSRGLRYQLLRTERANIFIGRMVGTFIFSLIVLGGLMATVMLYLIAKAKFYPVGDVMTWMVRGYVMMAIYALPWIALCAWVSCLIDSPFGALVISLLFIGFWPVLIFFGKGANEAVAYGGYASPWAFKWWLFHPSISHVLAGTAVMLAFTAFFTFLGLRHFQKRDL